MNQPAPAYREIWELPPPPNTDLTAAPRPALPRSRPGDVAPTNTDLSNEASSSAIPQRDKAQTLQDSDLTRLTTKPEENPASSADVQADASVMSDNASNRSPWLIPGISTAAVVFLASLLSLSAHNQLLDVKEGFRKEFGITIPAGQSITGWWAVDDVIANDLAKNNRLIFGVVGGLVQEVARIVSPNFYTKPTDHRKAFIIEKLNAADSKPYSEA